MKLKLDEDGNVVVVDGKPVYVDDDGKDVEVDVPMLFIKVTELNDESKTHRLKAKEVGEELKSIKDKLDGIEDLDEWLETAKTALDTVAGLDGKSTISAEKVKELRAEINSAWEDKNKALKDSYEEKLAEGVVTVDGKDKIIRKLTVSNEFASSPFFSGQDRKTILLPDMAEVYFGPSFKVEENDDGEMVVAGYIGDNRILSRANPGEPADFNECIAEIIDKHPQKVDILKTGKGGTGSRGNAGDVIDSTDLGKLKEAYDTAEKANDVSTMVGLKSRIHAVEHPPTAP